MTQVWQADVDDDLSRAIIALHSTHADSRWIPFAEALAGVVAAAGDVDRTLEALPVLVASRASLSVACERLRRVGVDLILDRGLGGIDD